MVHKIKIIDCDKIINSDLLRDLIFRVRHSLSIVIIKTEIEKSYWPTGSWRVLGAYMSAVILVTWTQHGKSLLCFVHNTLC